MPTVKYHNVSELLERYIRENCLSGRLPGVLSLSKKLGFHHSTLMKAIRLLESRGLVRVEGRRGTFIQDLSQASTLKTIGLVGFYDCSWHKQEILTQLNERYRSSGLQFAYVDMQLPTPELFTQALLSLGFVGFIFFGSSGATMVMKALHRHGIAVIGNIQDGLPWMHAFEFDHYHGYRTALEHLVSQGHRRIVCLECRRHVDFQFHLKILRRVWQEVLADDFDPALFIDDIDYTDYFNSQGDDYLAAILKSYFARFFTYQRPPTAFIGSIDFLEPLHEFLSGRGLKLPRDFSFIGVSSKSDQRCGNCSRIVINLDDQLAWAVPRLVALLAGEKLSVEKVLIPVEFISGNTSAPKLQAVQ